MAERGRQRVGGMLALAASALLLAGCGAAPVVPPGPTQAEVDARIDAQNAAWWESIAPGEPRPVIEPIEYLQLGDESTLVHQCLLSANIDGVTETLGGINYNPAGPEAQAAFDRLNYTCAMQYPYDMSNPEESGFFSDAQLGYLYDYFAERSVPCLRMLGYRVPDFPDRQRFIDEFYGSGYWIPYFQIAQGFDEHPWEQVQLRCPPPELIADWFGQPFLPLGG